MHQESILYDTTGEILLIHDFYSGKRLEDLLSGLELRQETIKIFGKEVLQPRLSALYGEKGTSYRYSGKTFDAIPWTGWLKSLAHNCSEITEVLFNTALLNYYRNGNDSMGLHADNEPELGRNPVIASVNYGATRKMIFRRNADKQKLIVELNDGDLLIMRGALQHFWKHELPKERRVEEPRLNVTFRRVFESPG